jgi:hypothetical protein
MRNFDFPSLRSTIYSARRASAIWVTGLAFQALAWITSAQISATKLHRLFFFAAELPARSIKWSYRAGPVSIQSKPHGCANLRHTRIGAQNEF